MEGHDKRVLILTLVQGQRIQEVSAHSGEFNRPRK